MPEYLPYSERHPCIQYQDLLRSIIRDGEKVATKQGPAAYSRIGVQMRFNLAHGFPIIVQRDMSKFWRSGIGELCAFINGARTLSELAQFGCKWWGPWATEDKCRSRGLEAGDLGPGSYGHAFRHFTTSDDPNEEGFDQFGHLIRKLRDLPEDRTALVSPWVPPFNHREYGIKSRNTIAPCHGWIQARVMNGNLHLHMKQRSGDTPVGVPSNMVQYAALGLMIEHLTGYKFTEYVHYIVDAHIYEDQEEHAREMMVRWPKRLPAVVLNEAGQAVSDIHDFRAEHFDLYDYDPHPEISGIPVSV
ncbi:MAG TPA: thymidylate synthase [Candidatus Dormibacteraeota bacterium]|nr:thymidylate synthase [Candidatus Dormibacteraeota bacterium]